MVDWGIRAKTWTAKSPQEQRLEYETHRLQVHEDKIHREIQTERRLLNEVEAIAADAAYDAREAYRDARYGYGSPYHRSPYITSPYLGVRNIIGHPGLTPGLGIGISPHLDAAQSVAAMQVRRDMAIAQQARRRLAQQFDSDSQAVRDYRTLIRAGVVPPPSRTPRMSGTPFLDVAPIVGTPHLNALHLGRNSIGYPPGRLPPGYLNGFGTPDPDSGLPAYAAQHMPHLTGAGLLDGLHDPLMERIAALEATTPLASTRLRRLSTPGMVPIDPLM